MLITLVILENFVNMYKSCDKFTINRLFCVDFCVAKVYNILTNAIPWQGLSNAIFVRFVAYIALSAVVRFVRP